MPGRPRGWPHERSGGSDVPSATCHDRRLKLRETGEQENRRRGENSLSPDPMSLLFKLLAASDSRPKLRQWHLARGTSHVARGTKQDRRSGEYILFLLIPCRSCSNLTGGCREISDGYRAERRPPPRGVFHRMCPPRL